MIRNKEVVVQFTVWDNNNNVPKTGDAANLTLRWIKNGTSGAPSNSPSEIDATNCPGQYKLTITASESDCSTGTICGKSSTSGVVIIPQCYSFEDGNDLADAYLLRDWTSISATVPARCMLQAFRFVRNKWAIATNVLTVYKEDGSTTAWAANLSVDANGRITAMTPTT